jgi:predicted transcriptional regulator
MEAIYRTPDATVAEIAAAISDPPSDGALRTLLGILERKGHLKKKKRGHRNVYAPCVARNKAARAALRQVLDTFFGGSMESAFEAHLSDPGAVPDADELARLNRLIQKAKKEGR